VSDRHGDQRSDERRGAEAEHDQEAERAHRRPPVSTGHPRRLDFRAKPFEARSLIDP
jgi:hypothetical protein